MGHMTGVTIGVLAQRVGVSAHALRAWERRYGLLTPDRSSGGYRLYDEADEERIREFLRLRESTGSAAAAAAVLNRQVILGTPTEAVDTLVAALRDGDQVRLTETLDVNLGRRPLAHALSEVVLPFLVQVGKLWEHGEIGIAEEHWASALVRGRLLNTARALPTGNGPVALLACPSQERHDLPLLALALLLQQMRWRIRFLGADTPLSEIRRAAGTGQCRSVVISTTIAGVTREPVKFPGGIDVWVGGRAAADVIPLVGGRELPHDLAAAAAAITAAVVGTAP